MCAFLEFSDVAASNWASGYVNVASNYGIIKGVGANMFAPDKEVSVAEFYTMAVRALNAGQLVEAEGTWPTNYVNFAIENKLAEDVAQVYSVPATRMTAATIVANTLTAKMWVKDSVRTNGEITWKEGENNILSSILNIAEYDHIVIENVNSKELTADFDNTAEYSTTNNYTAAEVKLYAFDKDGYDVNERANITLAKAGMSYTIWVDTKEKEVLGFWVPEDSETLKFDDIKVHNVTLTAGDSIKLTIDGTDKKFDTVSTGLKLFVNGADASLVVPNVGYALSGTAYYGLDSDSDKIAKIYVENFDKFGLVKEVTSNKIKFESIADATASTITIDNSKDAKIVYNVSKNGKQIKVEDIEAGDVVFYYTTTSDGIKTYTIKVYTDTVEGKVKSISGDKVKIDGKEYKDLTASISAGDEITAYLNEEGKILFFEKSEGSKGDYGVISAIRFSADKYDAASYTYEVKMTNLDDLAMTDWMDIDLEETADEMGLANKAAAESWVNTNIVNTTTHTYLTAPGYGKVLGYVVKGGKIVFTKLTDKDSNPYVVATVASSTFTSNDNADKVKTGSDFYYTTSDTKAFELDVNDKTSFSKKEVKVKAIELDDVDSMSLGANDVQMADIDFKNSKNNIGYIVFASANIKAETNWAFVLSAKAYSDDDNDDAKHIYSVVYADGTTATLYDETSTAKCAAGELYELTVKDEVITSATSDGTYNTTDELVELKTSIGSDKVYLNKEFTSRNTVSFAKYAGSNAVTAVEYAFDGTNDELEVILDENILVIRKDTEGKYHIADYDDLAALEENDLPYLATTDSSEKALNDKAVKDSYTRIENMYSFMDVDGSTTTTTLVAIVFVEED